MNRIDIHIVLKAASPLHITSPGSAYYDPDNNRIVHGKVTENFFPITLTRRRRFLKSQDQIASEEDARESSGKDYAVLPYEEVPILPSSGIRGALRRHCARRVISKTSSGPNGALSLDAYHGLMCGAATGNPSGDVVSYADYTRMASDPHVGLWGGTSRLLPGRTIVTSAVPLLDICSDSLLPQAQSLAEPFLNPSLRARDIIEYECGFRQDDALRGRYDDIRRSVKDPAEALAAWHNELSDGKIARKKKSDENATDDGKQTGRGLQRPWVIQAIAAGTALAFSIRADLLHVGAPGAGLLLRSVADMFASPYGGRGAYGFGQILPLASVVRIDDTVASNAIGVGNIDTTGHEALALALDAWEQCEISTNDIEEFYRRNVKPTN